MNDKLKYFATLFIPRVGSCLNYLDPVSKWTNQLVSLQSLCLLSMFIDNFKFGLSSKLILYAVLYIVEINFFKQLSIKIKIYKFNIFVKWKIVPLIHFLVLFHISTTT